MKSGNEVNYRQLGVLVKAWLRISFRGQDDSQREDRSVRSGFTHMMVTYFVTSIALCALSTICQNQITFNTLLISYGMLLSAFAVLIEYGDFILNAEDTEILFARPVNSRTYFWARLTTLSLFLFCYMTSLLLLPALVSFRFTPAKFYLFPVTFLVMLGACFGNALLVIYLYMEFLKHLNPARLSRLLAVFQVGFSFLLFLGYYRFLLHQDSEAPLSISKVLANLQTVVATGSTSFALRLDHRPLFHLVPSAWYAGAIDLIVGSNSRRLGLTLTALVVSGGVLLLASKAASKDYLTLLTEYNQQMPQISEIASRPSFSQTKSLIGEPAAKAGFWLVIRYLSRDRRLKRGIYPFLGILLFYLVYGWGGNSFLMDIFQAKSVLEVFGCHPFFVLLPVCILTTTNVFQYCADWKAAWIFHVSSADLYRLHNGYRYAEFVLIYIPIWILLSLYYSFHVPLLDLLWQMIELLLLLLFVRTVSFHFDPHLPLSEAPRIHAGFLRFSLAMVLLLLLCQALMALSFWASKLHFGLLWFNAFLLLAVVILTRLEGRRLRHPNP